MKKIIILGLCFSMMLSSCKKELDEQFYNPETYSDVGNAFSGLFTKTLYTWRIYVQDYGEWWWELSGSGSMGVAGYSQIAQRYITDRYGWFSEYNDLTGANGFENDGQLWNNRLGGGFYVAMNAWPTMKTMISGVTGQDLDDNQIYYALTTAIKDYAALMTVDFYNSIPYSEAFSGKDRVFFPKYDDPKEIYRSVLDDLKTISEQIPGMYQKMSASARAVFAVQDVAFGGNADKWVQYINAIRLRFAVRLSGVDEAFAKTHIQDLITKNKFPTENLTWQMPYALYGNAGGEWIRGISEGWPNTFVPDIIMRRMNAGTSKYEPGIDDPRLPVLAMPTAFTDYTASTVIGDYRGVNMNADAQKVPYNAGERYYTGGVYGDINRHLKENYRSMYNLATFHRNENFPVYMMSLSEVDLFLAEIAARGLATTGKTASAHLNDAIVHSVDFWYFINQKTPTTAGTPGSVPVLRPTKPAAAIIAKYADSVSARLTSLGTLDDKIELIMQQKFIHFNLMYPYELWAEQRRTRHPKLEPFTFNGSVMKPFPERLRYPLSEQTTNPDGYASVKSQDNFVTPIFWVPDNLKTVVPYWNDYNYK